MLRCSGIVDLPPRRLLNETQTCQNVGARLPTARARRVCKPGATMPSPERPLSPHLQVYRWQLTSVLSILHRASGVVLGTGTILLVWWLVAAASGPEAFEGV